ncbi:MAG TPA: hypothetical protein VH374_09360 [Polyangia bacterium]|nr:hypothetical protein [Polyangia bacterium]
MLLIIHAAAITVSGDGRGDCPSVVEVVQAIAARLTGVSASAAPSADPGALRLLLQARSSPPGPPVLQVELRDAGGQVLLRRVLPAAEGHRADCVALADTVAFIVDRYVAELDESVAARPPAPPPPAVPAAPPPPPAPPEPTTDAALVGGAAWRSAGDALEGFEALVGIDLQRAARDRGAGASLTVGIAPLAEGRWPNGRATLRRIPLRLGTYLSLAAGPGRLEPGLNLGIDALLVNARRIDGSAHTDRNVSPNVEAALAYRLRGGDYFARGGLAIGLAVPYRLTGLGDGSDGAVSTPRTYARVGVETGFYFR